MHGIEPRGVDGAVWPAQRREHDGVGMLFEQRDQLVVHVGNHVREDVDAGAQQILGVAQIGGVDRHPKPVLVRLVDDRAVQIRRELLDGTAAVVDPGLDDPHAPGDELLHGGPGALGCGDRERRLPHVVGADLRQRRQPSPGGEESSRVGMLSGEDLVAQLKRQLAEVAAHRLAGRNAEIREPAHVVEDVLARVVGGAARQVLHVADVRVPIDERGDHRLAGQVDAGRTRGRRHLATPPDAREPASLDEKGRVLDRARAVAGDQACAFVQRDCCGLRRTLAPGPSQPHDDEAQGNRESRGAHGSWRSADYRARMLYGRASPYLVLHLARRRRGVHAAAAHG